jgi:hypothetical protein
VRGFVSDAKGRARIERYESSDTSGSSVGYFAGLNREIRDQVESYSQWAQIGYPEAARRFVEKEISEYPDLVGAPISVLEIDGCGKVHWILKGACNTQEQEAD